MTYSKVYTALLFCVPIIVIAGDKTEKLDEISVVALRDASIYAKESANTTAITRQNIDALQSSSVAQVAQYIPNVSITGGERAINQKVDIRGLTGNRVAQVIDGVKQSFELKNRGSYFLPMSMVENIEVVKGAASTLWGNGALGGVVAMQTPSALDLLDDGQDFGAKVSQGYHSADNLLSSSAMLYGANEHFDALVGGFYNHADNLHLGGHRELPHSGYIQKGGLVKLGWQIDEANRLTLTQRVTRISQSSPNDNRMADGKAPQVVNFLDFMTKGGRDHIAQYKYTFLSHQRIADDSTTLDYYFNPNAYIDSQLTLYRNRTSETEKWLEKPIHDHTTYTTTGVNFKNASDFGRLHLTYGVDFAHNKVDTGRELPPFAYQGRSKGRFGGLRDWINKLLPSRNLPSIDDPNFNYNRRLKEYDGQSNNMGAYLLGHLAFFDERLVFSPAVRYDHYKVKGEGAFESLQLVNGQPVMGMLNQPKYSDKHFSPSMAMTLKPVDYFTLRVKYNEAFRAPSLQESFANGYLFSLKMEMPFKIPIFMPKHLEFPALLYANPNLKPEIARNKEISADFHFENVLTDTDKLQFIATYFRNDIKNLITPELMYQMVNLLEHRLVGQYVNIPKARITGVELEANYSTDRLAVGVGFGRTKGIVTKTDKNNPFFCKKEKCYLGEGDPLDDIPATKLTLAMDYFILPSELKIGTIISNYSAQRNISKSYIKNWSDGTPFDSYTLVEMHSAYYGKGKWKNVTIDFAIDNLFDRKYRPAFSLLDGVGRNFKLNVSYQF